MSEINWGLAPEGAVTVLQDLHALYWGNDKGEWFDTGDNTWNKSLSKHVAIATRPQQKTVADAYEWANGEWQGDSETIWWSKNFNQFEWGDNITSDTICTREQFEAYAKEQEGKQDGEKWTHTYINKYGDNIECRVIAGRGEFSWVESEVMTEIVLTSSLKPIKPTLTKAEAWDKAVLAGNVSHITDNYDII